MTSEATQSGTQRKIHEHLTTQNQNLVPATLATPTNTTLPMIPCEYKLTMDDDGSNQKTPQDSKKGSDEKPPSYHQKNRRRKTTRSNSSHQKKIQWPPQMETRSRSF